MRLQEALAGQVICESRLGQVRTVAGVDVAVQDDVARAAVVVLSYPGLELLEVARAKRRVTFPYIPGLLAFREGPAVLAAWEKLPAKPDLLLFDGQGVAHPRGIGIASQMGLWLQTPAVGVAKSRLYGRHAEVGPRFGDRAELRDERDPARIIGQVLRTREKTNPLYISPGHLIDLEHAAEFVLACCRGYRLPEPTRWAHKVGAGAHFPPESGTQAPLL
jgi:deoxyribonuclease V